MTAFKHLTDAELIERILSEHDRDSLAYDLAMRLDHAKTDLRMKTQEIMNLEDRIYELEIAR